VIDEYFVGPTGVARVPRRWAFWRHAYSQLHCSAVNWIRGSENLDRTNTPKTSHQHLLVECDHTIARNSRCSKDTRSSGYKAAWIIREPVGVRGRSRRSYPYIPEAAGSGGYGGSNYPNRLNLKRQQVADLSIRNRSVPPR